MLRPVVAYGGKIVSSWSYFPLLYRSFSPEFTPALGCPPLLTPPIPVTPDALFNCVFPFLALGFPRKSECNCSPQQIQSQSDTNSIQSRIEMSRQIVLHRPSPSLDRLEPLLAAGNNSSFSSTTTRRSASFGEVAGGTTAECAAVFCCCPCSLVNLMYLTIYKLPKGLCRKALVHHRRKRLTRKGILPQRSRRCSCGCDDTEVHIHSISLHTTPASDRYIKSLGSDEEVMQLEKEMWGKFHGSGFGRSPSQRSDVV